MKKKIQIEKFVNNKNKIQLSSLLIVYLINCLTKKANVKQKVIFNSLKSKSYEYYYNDKKLFDICNINEYLNSSEYTLINEFEKSKLYMLSEACKIIDEDAKNYIRKNKKRMKSTVYINETITKNSNGDIITNTSYDTEKIKVGFISTNEIKFLSDRYGIKIDDEKGKAYNNNDPITLFSNDFCQKFSERNYDGIRVIDYDNSNLLIKCYLDTYVDTESIRGINDRIDYLVDNCDLIVIGDNSYKYIANRPNSRNIYDLYLHFINDGKPTFINVNMKSNTKLFSYKSKYIRKEYKNMLTNNLKCDSEYDYKNHIDFVLSSLISNVIINPVNFHTQIKHMINNSLQGKLDANHKAITLRVAPIFNLSLLLEDNIDYDEYDLYLPCKIYLKNGNFISIEKLIKRDGGIQLYRVPVIKGIMFIPENRILVVDNINSCYLSQRLCYTLNGDTDGDKIFIIDDKNEIPNKVQLFNDKIYNEYKTVKTNVDNNYLRYVHKYNSDKELNERYNSVLLQRNIGINTNAASVINDIIYSSNVSINDSLTSYMHRLVYVATEYPVANYMKNPNAATGNVLGLKGFIKYCIDTCPDRLVKNKIKMISSRTTYFSNLKTPFKYDFFKNSNNMFSSKNSKELHKKKSVEYLNCYKNFKLDCKEKKDKTFNKNTIEIYSNISKSIFEKISSRCSLYKKSYSIEEVTNKKSIIEDFYHNNRLLESAVNVKSEMNIIDRCICLIFILLYKSIIPNYGRTYSEIENMLIYILESMISDKDVELSLRILYLVLTILKPEHQKKYDVHINLYFNTRIINMETYHYFMSFVSDKKVEYKKNNKHNTIKNLIKVA